MCAQQKQVTQMHYHWGQTAKKKRNVATLTSAADTKRKSSVTCLVSQNDSREENIRPSESCQPNRDFFGVGTKLKKSIFKNNNQINSTVTTRTWVLSTEWIRTWPSTGFVSE